MPSLWHTDLDDGGPHVLSQAMSLRRDSAMTLMTAGARAGRRRLSTSGAIGGAGLAASRIRRETGARGTDSSDPSPVVLRRALRVIALVAAALASSHSASLAQSLSAPTSLGATTYSKSQINLLWNDPNPGP